ncbi:hypothetical protein J2S74_000901 [Evansella vedderi]|uniref:Lipoprotein n=1 Tax=Evansella vedderi TaxID=38282 RepID=A0ABT9ZQL3_9BACI|nr:DUF6612 family protein [Evansella vedderi]MDQ0253529.1 hypothetical protein [Evansella vedderi]
MKKIIAFLTACSTAFFLGACSDQVAGDKSLEDILNESITTMEELKSYTMDQEMEQQLGMTGEESVTMNMNMTSEIHQDPMLLFQTMSMDMFGETLSYESYFSEEHGFYIEDPMMGQWIKYPDSLVTELMDLEAQMSPEDQLMTLQQYISDLSLTTDNDSYIINLTGEDVDMQAIFEQLSGLFGDGMGEMDELLSEMIIDELEYEIVIDKDTMYQTEATVKMAFTMDLMGEAISTTQNMHIKFSNFNELDFIEIPEDVINNAVEMSEEDLFGF